MSDRYDLMLVIGRFQPFCNAHRTAIESMTSLAERIQVVVIGDEMPRSARYPFTADERIAMLATAGYDTVAVPEVLTADERLTQIKALSEGLAVCLLSFDADYRNLCLPRLTPSLPPVADVEAESEAVRVAWLEGWPAEGISLEVGRIMGEVVTRGEFPALMEEDRYILKYKRDWAAAPYPPVFTTVDTLIIYDGKVLLIKRGGLPGRGQWALPGGFLDTGETLFEAALRELHEETGLSLLPEDGRARLQGQRVFDQPERSARGRTITHAFFFDLSGLDLPAVVAGDDATAAKWTGIDCALNMRKHMFEDHYLILDYFLRKA